MLGEINFERFLSYILMTALILYSVSFLIRFTRSNVEKGDILPSCYGIEIKTVFSNFFDKNISGYTSIYRKNGKIYIRNCNSSLKLVLDTNCNEYYLVQNETTDYFQNETFISIASGDDCDILVFNCSKPFWIYIKEKNKTFCLGDICENNCFGDTIREEYYNSRNSIIRVYWT